MIKLKQLIEQQDDFELKGKMKWHNLFIDIENKRGTYRSGKDPGGKKWKQLMHVDYGRLRGTETKADKEELDVYIYSNKDSDFVYQIKQMKAPKFKEFDEFKYLINCPDKKLAIDLYKKQYDDDRFFGGINEIPTDYFVKQIKSYLIKKHKN